MDKKQLYILSLKIKQLLNKKQLIEAEKVLGNAKLGQEEFDFIEECLHSYSYDYSTDSFSIAHGDNSEFFQLIAVVIATAKNKKTGGFFMNKKQLYSFSLEIKELINKQEITEAEKRLQQAALSQEEFDFVEMCLTSDGYDPTTDSFILCESDNSAFLKLVNVVISKTSKKK